MSLVVGLNKSKQISKWCEYKDAEGNVLAEIKVRGISYKPYQVAVERAQNQISSKGFDVDTATTNDKLFHELLLDAAACHLIEDWKGIAVPDENGEPKDFIYTTENAKKLLNEGDIGPVIWLFVKSNAEEIQREADGIKAEVLGKSENSMSGQKSVAKPKPRATRKSQPISEKQAQ
jgi:hypothetical protein